MENNSKTKENLMVICIEKERETMRERERERERKKKSRQIHWSTRKKLSEP